MKKNRTRVFFTNENWDKDNIPYTLNVGTRCVKVKLRPIYEEREEVHMLQLDCCKDDVEYGRPYLALTGITVSIIEYTTEKKVSFENLLDRLNTLSKELDADIIIRSENVGFGLLVKTDNTLFEETISYKKEKEIVTYYKNIAEKYCDIDNMLKDLYIFIQLDYKGMRILGVESSDKYEVNLSTDQVYFYEGNKNNILNDEDAKDFIFDIIDSIEGFLDSKGILNPEYSGFTPKQYK